MKTTYLHSKKIIAIPTINLAYDCFAQTVIWLANDGELFTQAQKLLITDITTDYQTQRDLRKEELSLAHQRALSLTEITPEDYDQVQDPASFFTNPYPIITDIETQIINSEYNYFVLNLVFGGKSHGIGIIKSGTPWQVFDKAKPGSLNLAERIWDLAANYFHTSLTAFQVIPYEKIAPGQNRW